MLSPLLGDLSIYVRLCSFLPRRAFKNCVKLRGSVPPKDLLRSSTLKVCVSPVSLFISLIRQSISNADFRQNIPGTGMIFFDFTPQTRHQRTQRLGIRTVCRSPNLFYNKRSGKHLPHMPKQQSKKTVFHRRYMNLYTIQMHHSPFQINLQPSHLQNCLGISCTDLL